VAERALDAVPIEHGRALLALAEQSVHRGIDYATVGLGWSHPQTRLAYRQAGGGSFSLPASRQRQERSRGALARIVEILAEAGRGDPAERCVSLLVAAFCEEIGAPGAAGAATFPAVAAALEGELLLPLRALQEGVESMTRTFLGAHVPREPIQDCVNELTSHVLDGTFSSWRYENPVGRRQLEGLSVAQIAKWREPSATRQGKLLVHEDAAGELGFFWATKIGGPSHGFDFEAQCLLPLLCNARHKVILVTAREEFPHNPCGRCHFRLLWQADSQPPKAVLWLESVHLDFGAGGRVPPCETAVLKHAVAKADAMGLPLSVDTYLGYELAEVVGNRGTVREVEDRLVLRPSNGVMEASDYLSNEHDWVQTEEEITQSLPRILYEPPIASAAEEGAGGLWEVIGGADKGGIIVRSGKDIDSHKSEERLSFGAVIKQEALVGERLCFIKVEGTGPDTGWVSTQLQGKDLVVRKTD